MPISPPIWPPMKFRNSLDVPMKGPPISGNWSMVSKAPGSLPSIQVSPPTNFPTLLSAIQTLLRRSRGPRQPNEKIPKRVWRDHIGNSSSSEDLEKRIRNHYGARNNLQVASLVMKSQWKKWKLQRKQVSFTLIDLYWNHGLFIL